MALSIGIIGVGFVGDALLTSFSSKGIKVYPYDKFKAIGSLESALNSDIIFLALPTLYKDELQAYDKSALHEISEKLRDANYKGMVIIKSTVEPGTTEALANQYNLKFVHNPEFLTARTAREDFENQSHIVLGKSVKVVDDELQILIDFYAYYYPKATISTCLATESESMKIMVNTFYSVKVQIFNEFYLYCKSKNIDYDCVKNLMLKNGWINPMHTTVPGPDGKLSYGGACFPKDSSALLADMLRLGTPSQVLAATKKERDEMRPEK
jgi:UDPglucose 6-dehydrogenase